MTEQLTYAYLGGITKSRDTAGFLHIKGLASDDTLDLDGQICDPEWLESSMGEWFKTGNLREMHGMTAVGKATGMSQSGTGFYIEGKIETQSWDDAKSGQKKYRTVIIVNELVLLDKPQALNPQRGDEIPDEDIPF